MSANQHLNDSNIDFWIKNNLNVLLRGKHGVGKTARILEAFKRHNLKFQYFSASTMDPWVDFIGVPKEKIDENGNSYLDLVRPKVWQDDSVQAIFLDEFNRSSKKVRNAVMELIQFKSINGKVFKNLKFVWAAINPEDEEVNKYDVEALDPAQMDRFHVIVNVPYAPDASYFRGKYGRDTADIALGWWKETLKDNEREMVSPRRLDYIIDIFNKGGDIRPLLHSAINTLALTQQLKNGPLSKQLEELYEKKDTLGGRKFLLNENNYNNAINHVLKKRELTQFFIPLLSDEKQTILMNQHKQVAEFIFGNYEAFKGLIHSISASKSGQLSHQATSVIMSNIKVGDLTENASWDSTASESVFTTKLTSIKGMDSSSTAGRQAIYRAMEEYLPSTLNTTAATDALRVLEAVLCRSNRDVVLRDLPRLPQMVGYVISTLEKAGIKWEPLVDAKTVIHKLNDINTYIKAQKGVADLNKETGDSAVDNGFATGR